MSIKFFFVSLVLVACGHLDQPTQVPPSQEAVVNCPRVPPGLVPPVPVGILFGRAAHGVEIYSCEGTPQGPQWGYVGPRVELYDLRTGRLRETHQSYPSFASPDDGSMLQTSVYQEVQVTPGIVSWALLVTVASSPGPTGYGDLGFVSWVQRLDTSGGLPPTSACVTGQVTEVPFDALYVFYGDDGEGECR